MSALLRTLVVSALTAALLAAGHLASAGQVSDVPVDPLQSPTTPGWTLTPSLATSRTFDDNVLVRGPGDLTAQDYLTTVSPRGELAFNSPRGHFSAQYDGEFAGYQNLQGLNSYSQSGSMSLKRMLSKRSTFFFTASAASSPTTELLQIIGVPFVRVGSFTDDARAGLERIVSKRLTITVGAHFGQARFDQSQAYAAVLLGGNSVGGDVSLRHRLTARTSLTADADAQYATIGQAREPFAIQHAMGGVEQQLSQNFRVFAAGGISRLGETSFGPARTGPSIRVGISERYRSAIVDVSYNRSFVPSFGIGGTTQNEDLTARVRLPITRRLYTQDLVSLQQADPLVIASPQLRSAWLELSVGYAVQRWIRVEGFFAGTRQTVDRPDLLLMHNRYGIQVIASKPVRIR